jgi:hypothetical protein
VEHLERWGFVVMKRPPIGGVAALGRLHRAYDRGAFDPTVWGIFEPCEDEAVDGRNALNSGHSQTVRRTGQVDPVWTYMYMDPARLQQPA